MVLSLYELTKDGKRVKVGTLKSVWNYAINNLGNMTAEQFQADGYKIDRVKAA